MAKNHAITSRSAILILAFSGFIFSAVGGGFTYFSYDFHNNSQTVTGTVVSVARSTSDGSTTYKPTIAYVDMNGIMQSAETSLSSSSYNYARGAEVEVLYDTRDPSSLRINSWFALWGFGLVFLLSGLGPIGIMLYAISKRRKMLAGVPKNSGKPEYRSRKAAEPDKPTPSHQPTVRRR